MADTKGQESEGSITQLARPPHRLTKGATYSSTPDRKRLRALGRSSQESDRSTCRMLKFDRILEESDGEMEEDDAEEEEADFSQVQYEEHEIPDTQDEDAPLIRTWDPTMFFMILEKGMIYLKSKKLTKGETEAVEDLMAAAHKALYYELFTSMVTYDEQFTGNVRKGVAKMDNHQVREEHLLIMDEFRKADKRRQERTFQTVVRKVSVIEKSLTSIRVATGTATFEEKKAVEKDVRRNKAEEVKKVVEEKTKQSEKKAKAT